VSSRPIWATYGDQLKKKKPKKPTKQQQQQQKQNGISCGDNEKLSNQY
jgi:hypothetical protein